MAAMQTMAASKVLVIMDNPFIPGLLAFIVLGEAISILEIFMWTLTSVGIYLIAERGSGEVTTHTMDSQLVGIACMCVASLMNAMSLISLRQLIHYGIKPVGEMPVLIFMMYFNSIFNTANFLFIDTKRSS